MSEVKILIIPKDTTIKINGIPFTLKEDTEVYGLVSNLELAFSNQGKLVFSQEEQSPLKPCHE